MERIMLTNVSFPPAPKSLLREMSLATAMVLLVHLLWLAADHVLRIYMGDSMVFLQAAKEWSSPGARSYPYGWALHTTQRLGSSTHAIFAFNLACAAVTSLGLFYWLRRHALVPLWPCLIASTLLATEPAQVFLARMVMAESFGLAILVATFICLAQYLRSRRLFWFGLAGLAGLLAAALRTNFLPQVLGMALVAAALPLLESGRMSKKLQSAALGLLMLTGMHMAYTQLYGRSVAQPAGYVAHSGMMAIGLVAPLIKPEHFEDTGVSGSILTKVELPLDDHWQRGNHIWANNGLWAALRESTPEAELVARTITRRAMLDDPMGLLKINLQTAAAYFDKDRTYWRMQDDIGVIAPDDYAMKRIQEWYDWDVHGLSEQETPARTYFSHSGAWLTFCFLALVPLALVTTLIGWNKPQRLQYLLLGFTSLGLIACHLLFVHIVSFRYLHPLPWFVFAHLAIIAGWMLQRARPGRECPDKPMP